MSKFFKRIGTQKFRYQFDIVIQEARLNIPMNPDTQLIIAFKWGKDFNQFPSLLMNGP